LCEEVRKGIREIPIDVVQAKLERNEEFELIDVREDHEWNAGHVRGARHIGRGILERDIETALPNPDAEIVLYCGGGFRSALAAESLARMGYRRVLSMAGGFRGWKEAGGPVE
jgi:rhodanese-related sulfurtransferase